MAVNEFQRLFRPDVEARPVAERAAAQRRGLIETVRRARATGFYAEKLATAPDDLAGLPFTSRPDLVSDQAGAPPFGRFHAVTVADAALVGRTGVGFSATRRRLNLLASAQELRWQAGLFARAFFEAGVRSSHRVYIGDDPRYNVIAMYAMHGVMAIGAIMLYTAAEASARTARYVIPALPPDHMFMTPTYAQYFPEVVAERSSGRWPIKSVSGWGEPGFSNAHVRERLQQRWQAVTTDAPLTIVDVYALSETGLVGMGCREGGGLHVFDDSWIVEIVQPEGERVLGEERVGEVVLTRLGGQGAPFVRYRTGDVALLDASPCPCGRTAPRLRRIQRLADALGHGGRAVFPIDVEEALVRSGVSCDSLVIERAADGLRLRFSGSHGPVPPAELSRRLTAELGIPITLSMEMPAELPPFLHKSMRVVDETSRDAFRSELDYQRELEHV